jgi:hypothetical protein
VVVVWVVVVCLSKWDCDILTHRSLDCCDVCSSEFRHVELQNHLRISFEPGLLGFTRSYFLKPGVYLCGGKNAGSGLDEINLFVLEIREVHYEAMISLNLQAAALRTSIYMGTSPSPLKDHAAGFVWFDNPDSR